MTMNENWFTLQMDYYLFFWEKFSMSHPLAKSEGHSNQWWAQWYGIFKSEIYFEIENTILFCIFKIPLKSILENSKYFTKILF